VAAPSARINFARADERGGFVTVGTEVNEFPRAGGVDRRGQGAGGHAVGNGAGATTSRTTRDPMDAMGHSGHNGGMSMDAMVRDMRNRFIVAAVL